jgi:hypothetical protein
MRRLGLTPLLAALALPVALCVGMGAAVVSESVASASVLIAITFDDLVGRSSSAAFVTPFESRSVWENARIYTYTHVHVDTAVGGSLASGDEPWVRTMGGIVGGLGQVVDGEAVLTTGRPTLLFLHDGPAEAAGALEVTARAQGQYAIRLDDKGVAKLVLSSAAGGVIPPSTIPVESDGKTRRKMASELLHQRPIPDATHDIAAAWSRLHAR